MHVKQLEKNSGYLTKGILLSKSKQFAKCLTGSWFRQIPIRSDILPSNPGMKELGSTAIKHCPCWKKNKDNLNIWSSHVYVPNTVKPLVLWV